jgi:hypothetical protein
MINIKQRTQRITGLVVYDDDEIRLFIVTVSGLKFLKA